MSYYDYEEYYSEPSEFDEKCQELIQMLKDSATQELKAELKQLRKENADMKDIVNNYEQKVAELEKAKRNYEWKEKEMRLEIAREVRKLRLSELLEEFQTTLYCVRNRGKEKPKCNKCDEDGYVDYWSPRGRKQRELCECRERETFYIVEKANCSEFTIRTENGKEKIVGWYKANNSLTSNGEDYYTSEYATYVSNKIYKGEKFSEFESHYSVYFYDEETAQKYADWLNGNLKNEVTENDKTR